MPNFRKLRVFELSQELSEEVHRLVPGISAWRAPGLRGQLCRAVASVPANIAEGAAQGTQAGFARYLVIALGSANEAGVHLRLAGSLPGKNRAQIQGCIARQELVSAMLTRLIATIRENEARKEDDRRSK